MGISNLLSPWKRRLLPGVQIPMHTEALLSQMKDAVAITLHLPIDSPRLIETFFELMELHPLICGLLSELKPGDASLFWDTYGDWLLHKVHHPLPSFDSPRVGPAAHRADVYALKFATHHLWPASIWRDKHCYRCSLKKFAARPLRLASTQCDRHSCQSWALRLLRDLREKHPEFTPSSLLPRRSSESKSRRRRRSRHPAKRQGRRQSTHAQRGLGSNDVGRRQSEELKGGHLKDDEQKQPMNQSYNKTKTGRETAMPMADRTVYREEKKSREASLQRNNNKERIEQYTLEGKTKTSVDEEWEQGEVRLDGISKGNIRASTLNRNESGQADAILEEVLPFEPEPSSEDEPEVRMSRRLDVLEQILHDEQDTLRI